MTSSYFRIIPKIKYIFTAAVAACLTSNYGVFSNEQKFLSNYESETGLKFPQSIIDLACLANTFPSQFKQKQNENNICYSSVYKNYTEIKQIKNLFYDDIDQSFISNPYPSLGIKGFHLKVFEKDHDDQTKYVFVIVRHQEHESVFTDEMNEMMSLFGPAATVDRQQGNKEVFGASAISTMIRFIRQQFGLDYLPQAILMFDQIQSYYQQEKQKTVKYIFSGFSSGGLYAIVLALYYNYPVITFSATGVEDIIKIYYSNLFTNKSNLPPIFNFANKLDPVPQLDCQLGTLCLYESEDSNQEKLTDKELQLLHLNTIFGEDKPYIIEWLNQLNRWTCTTPDDYNLKYGSCKRERMRWKDRIKSNSVDDDEQTIKKDL